MLDNLSCDAVEPDQLAQLHDMGLSQPLRPAQGPGGVEVEWWKLWSLVLGVVLGRACSIESSGAACFQFVLSDGKHGVFSLNVFGRMTINKPRAHQLPLTESPSKFDERFYRPVIAKFR